MLGEQSAARAERQTLDVRALIGAARRTVRGAGRPGRRIPNRPRADDARGRDVLVEERRRHLQDAGDVVEAVGFVVLGQEGAGVDAQPEQFLDGGGIFGAVEPMQRHASRIRVRRGGLVERALQPGHEAVHGRLVGPAHARRRHHAAAQLPHGFLPDLRVVGQMREVHGVEREVGGLGALVVARHAVLVEERTLRGLGSRRRARLPAANAQPTDARHDQRRARRDRREQQTIQTLRASAVSAFIVVGFRQCHRARGRAATCCDRRWTRTGPDFPTSRRTLSSGPRR